MRLFLISVCLCTSIFAAESVLDELLPQLGAIERLEQLSKERRYGEIFDTLSSEYRRGVDRESWVKRSTELGWIIEKIQVGTLAENGDFADAPVKAETLIDRKKLHIHAVVYLVREDGVWRLWNFPFAPAYLMDRPYWPPPFQRPNQALQPTRMLVTFRAYARPAPSTRVAVMRTL